MIALALAATLAVRCTPGRPMRGEDVTCLAELTPAGDFVVVERRAIAQGSERVERVEQPLPAGHFAIWRGPAVVATRVAFVVESGGARVRGEGGFEVRPRAFGRVQLAAQNACAVDEAARELADPPPLERRETAALGAKGILSSATLDVDPPEWSLVSAGPNTGWYWISAPVAGPARLRTLVTRSFEPGSRLRALQHSDVSLPPAPQGFWPHCRKVDVEVLRSRLRKSEGCDEAGEGSRPALVRRQLEEIVDVNAELEALIAPIRAEASQNEFVQRIKAKLRELTERTLLAAEATPEPVSLPCRLRLR